MEINIAMVVLVSVGTGIAIGIIIGLAFLDRLDSKRKED